MAAAAYAALVSLLNTVDHIQTHPLLSTFFNNYYPNESLREKIHFFLDFVDYYSDADSSPVAEDLLRRIAVVARKTDDLIEVKAAELISGRKSVKRSRNLNELVSFRIAVAVSTPQSQTSMPNLLDDMDSIKEQIIKIDDETRNRQPTSSSPPASTSALENDEIIEVNPGNLILDMQNREEDVDPFKKKVINAKEKSGSINKRSTSSSSPAMTAKMVGFDGYLEQLLDQLTGHHSGRQILPIIGMAGIGKTTLARNVYENSLVVEHFYVCAWVTISQEFSVSEILLQALSCLRGSNSDTDRTNGQLGQKLHRILYGRRYLIVLDDVWSIDAWDEMKSYLPENNNGSRVIITTRQSELVRHFGSSALAVGFLDDRNSWDLFCENSQGCPRELEVIGHKIVRKCKGLPLAIVVVGGLIRKSPRTQKFWEKIADDKSLILDLGEEGSNPWSILYLSYKHLPVWLKSCFLYFGLFPEDHHIKVSHLIKLWVAEGLIQSNADQSMEEVAENYLKELVGRNLVLVGSLRLNKKLKSCFLHDLVRDLCLRIAEKEKFYYVQNLIDQGCHLIVDERTARFYCPWLKTSVKTSLVSPLVLKWRRPEPSHNSRLLRVLFSNVINPSGQFHLRLLILDYHDKRDELLRSISQLWGLQTLVLDLKQNFTAPCEIWNMPCLRHINIDDSIQLSDPPASADVIVLQNLQTLATLCNFDLNDEVCKRIPNIKKLGLRYCSQAQTSFATCNLQNVACLSKLEALKCSYRGSHPISISSSNLKLPSSLKKLTLDKCSIVMSDVAIMASLSHIQILKLLNGALVDVEWDCVGGEFLCLKYLEISMCDHLTHWVADSSSFPVLETLILHDLPKLVDIPLGIGEVATLEEIKVLQCSNSATLSAVKIVEEQENLGNLDLRLDITLFEVSDAAKWKKEIEELDITCQNIYFNVSFGDYCRSFHWTSPFLP